MFRAALFSIVVSMAGGQNVALLCRTWCDAHAGAASGCHHENSPTIPNVAGDESCNSVVPALTAVLRENEHRGVSSPDANQAMSVPCYRLAQLTTDARPGREPWSDWSLTTRSFGIALRI